jgi:hypothetical protein
MKDFMRMIVRMNEKIEQYMQLRWQVEKVGKRELKGICYLCNINFSIELAERALKSVPTDTHKHHDAEYLTWDDIEDCKEKEMLKEQSERYGY